jgi:sRNA-binding regulator protein Hfq
VTQRFTEDAWLDAHIGRAIHLYLCSGIKLIGLLKSHDIDVIVLGGGSDNPHSSSQLIYKSAISTIQPIPTKQAIRSAQAPIVLQGRNQLYEDKV